MTSGEAFYRKHAADLSRLATAMVGHADGPDVFANAMLRVLQSKRWQKLDCDAQRAYAYKAVVNEARDWSRAMGRRRQREAMWATSQRPTVSPEIPQAVWDVVTSLSPKQRAAVFLTFWADLDGLSVAEAMGISEGSVRQHLARARSKMKGALHV